MTSGMPVGASAPARHRVSGRVLAAVLGLTSIVLATSPALAGNSDDIIIGNQGARLAGAVTATVNDGSALWYNPAALGVSDADTLDLSGTLTALRYTHIDGILRSASGASTDGEVLELFGAPSTLAHQVTLESGIALAYGVFATARELIFTQADIDTTEEELDEWYVAVSSDLERYHAGVGIAFPTRKDLRVGVALFGVYESESSSLQLTGGEPSGQGPAVTLIQQSSRSAFGVQASLAFHATPSESWYFGMTAFTPLILVGGTLDRLETTDITIDDGTGNLVRGRDVSNAGGIDIGVTVSSPARVRAGLAHQLGRLLVSLDGDIQAPLEQPELDIQQEAVPNFRAGADYAYDDQLTLGAGLFTDFASDRKATTIVDFGGFTVGFATRTRNRLAPGESSEALDFTGFFAFRYALGLGRSEGLMIRSASDPEGLVTAGRSRTVVHEFGLNIGTGIEF